MMITQEQIAEKTEKTPNAAKEIVVSVRGLTKIFKDFWGRAKAKAVDNVDFDVYKGEVFGLLGPNGSGKSTTIKMLLGLLNPTKGKIEILGHSPKNVAIKSRIGYLPEESYLYRYLDSRETLDFFGRLFQISESERKKRTEQLLEMVGLSGVFNRPVGEFSKGMQRRIGLAQALINDPDLIILDEPTSGLDPIGCREVKDLILTLAKRGKTIILSSHLLADVEDVCDRVVIYYGGKIHAMGALKDLLSERDMLRITVPLLSKETLRRVIDIIKTDVEEDKIKIDHPTQNLESYFLEVVRKAREQLVETSGAVSQNVIAAYLRGDAETSPDEKTEKLLEKLTYKREEKTEDKKVVSEEPKIDESKLETLVSPPVKLQEEQSAQTQVKQPDVDLEKVNEKLSSLINKPK